MHSILKSPSIAPVWMLPLRSLSISRSPPQVAPKRAFIPQRAERDPFVEPPPKLFVDQPHNITSTGPPPLKLHRRWTKNSGRNRSLKRAGYLYSKPTEEFGAPQFVMPGDEAKAPVPVLDISVWNNAIVLVDKPKRWTSFDVCGKLRKATFGYPFKVGHAGTLDPLATGLLIVCMGSATHCAGKFVGLPKEYSGSMKLGEMTPSYDAGEPISERRPWEHITDAQIKTAAKKLVGDIKQLPPMYSAIKKDGKRLYQLAREGKTVKREKRNIKVDEFKVRRSSSDPQVVYYRIKCGSGTYVRSLVHDLGQSLGCGSYVRSLRRDAVGPYRLSDAWEIEQLLKVIADSKIASR